MLEWLAPGDRDLAGERYECVRKNIIRNYARRGCPVAEDLADEAINRVAEKLPEIIAVFIGDPALYFYGVANKILLEYGRKRSEYLIMPIPASQYEEDPELVYACLEECLSYLTPEDRELICHYFMNEKRAKIEGRKQFANKLGIPLNTLRTRAYRVKLALRDCITVRLKSK